MALVIPFKGIFYNPEKIGSFASVVAPPYDVISIDEQKKLNDRHPHNIIRLILGEPGENSEENRSFYQAAGERFRAWRKENVLVADQVPAFYFTSVEFKIEDVQYLRHGLIGYVRLEDFEKRVVLPHERTSSKVKEDRLNLLKSSCANFCQIFSLFSDAEKVVIDTLAQVVSDRQPDIDLVDDSQERHQLWKVTDSAITEQITAALADKRLYIADGHHRYETALNYRNWVAQNDPTFNEDHPANYIMMYLSAMSDPGLVILPTHRMLPEVEASVLVDFIGKAGAYFDIEAVAGNQNEEFLASLRAETDKNTIGVSIRGQSEFYLLTPRSNLDWSSFGQDIPEVLRGLDVTILTRLILIHLLGFTQAELDEEKAISYTSDAQKAIDAVAAGDCAVSFLLNATKNEQMRAVAAAGEIMPRKTTFYYPKVLTGLILSDKSGGNQDG